MYLGFLNENIDKYNLVLHVDIRDSIFQKNFFQIYDIKKPFLGVALEESIFLNETINKGWFIYAFGEDEYKKVENERIICSGTIWGTADKFLQLLIEIWEKVKNGVFNMNWHDQAAFNYIIYNEKIFDDCLLKTENKDGNVLTLAIVKNKNISLDSEDNILNYKGEIVALVHQYDRIKYIKKKVKKKFCVEEKEYLRKKYKNTAKKKYLKSFIIFLLFSIILIIIIFFMVKTILIRKKGKYGSKKYKFKKMKKNKTSIYKFQF